MAMEELTKIPVSLLPVLAFLTGLILIDSYKLVKLRSVLLTIGIGCLAAIVCIFINGWLLKSLPLDLPGFSRYVAPVIEEGTKAGYLVFLIRYKKVGFMVDAAIYGFAVGAGFALVENVYYLYSLESHNILLWIVRGFGTAIMHGGSTAIVGILSKSLADVRSSDNPIIFLPGLAFAMIVHSAFNHFLLPPLATTMLLLVIFPVLIMMVFEQSEKNTRRWLGSGFDTDMELLAIITSGKISEMRIGHYLETIRHKFPGEVIADMLCMLRIYLELALRAKGLLMMQGTGFKVASDPDIKAKFKELKYLEKSIGKTGKLAIKPLLRGDQRDLWQIHHLSQR